jgi:hypothetical protein
MSRKVAAPFRLALSIPEAAASLGFSETHFRAEILPDLPVLRGTRPRILVHDLEAWAERRKEVPKPPQPRRFAASASQALTLDEEAKEARVRGLLEKARKADPATEAYRQKLRARAERALKERGR